MVYENWNFYFPRGYYPLTKMVDTRRHLEYMLRMFIDLHNHMNILSYIYLKS